MTMPRAAALLLASVLLCADNARAADLPPWLPQYKLDIHLDVCERLVTVKQRILWTNKCACPTRQVVFNAHSRFLIPKKDIGLLAKTLEILRMAPSEAMHFDGPALDVRQVSLLTASAKPLTPDPSPRSTEERGAEMLPPPRSVEGESAMPLPFDYAPDILTALVVQLPHEVGPGESVKLELDFVLKIPPVKGRWSQWRGVTTLAQWLPVVAVYDEKGWQPAPFIPWHQPFFNEAGIYEARITLPSDQKLACTGPFAEEVRRPDGWTEYHTAPIPARDFALICSANFCEERGQAGNVLVRSLYLPEHEFYGKLAVKVACDTIPVYSQWFGDYPYPQFTIVESFFGWNGNECGGLVMIDERMYGMPHIAKNYVDYLIAHEICHQWFYNVIGTNGYCETFMDEGPATYFSHRLADIKLGKNNAVVDYPRGLGWAPNIHRDDLRNYGQIGVFARGEGSATVQEMEKFKHLVNLMAHTYDRGSKIIGMIEERMGGPAFLDFMRRLYCKYYFRILRVCDFQRELEEYTGHSWADFFQCWLFSPGMTDWVVERVDVQPLGPTSHNFRFLKSLTPNQPDEPTRLVVHLSQRKQCNEPTVLGISFAGEDCHELRLPINPCVPATEFKELNAKVECECSVPGCTKIRVEVLTPACPRQVTVDPDKVLLDCDRCNNHWKPKLRMRVTPVYTQLEELDVTTAHDSWNFIVGPWLYFSSYADPWYQRTGLAGVRAGFYQTQKYAGGAYLGYRADDRNIVAGVDGLIDHFPFARTQVGFNAEQSLATLSDEDVECSRAVVYGRYILMYGSSLYLPPFEYVEVFADVRNRCLPLPDQRVPGDDLFDEQMGLGIHYHKYLLTPYWDPEGGVAVDATYRAGLPVFGRDSDFHQVFGEVSAVKDMPDVFGLKNSPYLHWLGHARWAFRLFGAAAWPERGLFYTLGGGNRFRGFDLSERQGSMAWVGSIELRIPIAKELNWHFCDHLGNIRHIYLAPFYDVGNIYDNRQALGPVAHAVGAGLRVDVTWLGLIERTMLRLDVAKAINEDTPVQFWLGIQHPF